MKEIWFAGGCFWGTEKLFRGIRGVISTEVGYANGDPSITPTYELVCRMRTGYRETVHVTYDPDVVSTDYLVYSFYRSVDPTMKNRQGNDYGPQYQACIFWNDADTEDAVLRITDVESKRYEPFNVVTEELSSFVAAEEYHQDYLGKNEHGYCHIDPYVDKMIADRVFDPAPYTRPSDEQIRSNLSGTRYAVTQESATEPPFDNEYDGLFEKGIYVDTVTGEPLFSSASKYDSGCGWPAFSRPIDMNSVVFLKDSSLGMTRIEARSRVGNTHLGHVFYGEPKSPTHVRFCINSASLRFIPLQDMVKEGYGAFVKLVE